MINHHTAQKKYPELYSAFLKMDKLVRDRFSCPYSTLRNNHWVFKLPKSGHYDAMSMYIYNNSGKDVILRATNMYARSCLEKSRGEIRRSFNRIPDRCGYEISFLPEEIETAGAWILDSLEKIKNMPDYLERCFADTEKLLGKPLDHYLWTIPAKKFCNKIQRPGFKKRSNFYGPVKQAVAELHTKRI